MKPVICILTMSKYLSCNKPNITPKTKDKGISISEYSCVEVEWTEDLFRMIGVFDLSVYIILITTIIDHILLRLYFFIFLLDKPLNEVSLISM